MPDRWLPEPEPNESSNNLNQENELKNVSMTALAWRSSGMHTPTAASAHLPWCSIPECSGMAYVQVKTVSGNKSLCFQHFGSVKNDLERTSGLGASV